MKVEWEKWVRKDRGCWLCWGGCTRLGEGEQGDLGRALSARDAPGGGLVQGAL